MTHRILYVGSLRPGGNGLDRVAMLEQAGFDVDKVDRFPFMQTGYRIERSLAARHHQGRGPIGFNWLLNARARTGGYDIVFVDKGVWVGPRTLSHLKAAARCGIAIHYTPDAQFVENQSRYFFRALPLYDLAVTTKPFEVKSYRDNGAQEVRLILQGYGVKFRPIPEPEIPEALRSDVCFVGHCQPHYAALLQELSSHVPLRIWGPGWTAYAAKHAWARPVVQADGCYGPDYTRVLSGAKIALGLLSKRIPETTTTRSFEIPACGTLLLAERTDDHRALFEEDGEAAFFDSAEECVEKARCLLTDDSARERIAAAGLARCQADGYSTSAQFSKIIDWLNKRIGLSGGR